LPSTALSYSTRLNRVAAAALIWPLVRNQEDRRREKAAGARNAMHAYLRAVLADVAQNVPMTSTYANKSRPHLPTPY